MLNMIEWWICLNIPPDEVNKIARFRELNDAQKALMLSARKKSGKFTEGSWDSQQQLNADSRLLTDEAYRHRPQPTCPGAAKTRKAGPDQQICAPRYAAVP